MERAPLNIAVVLDPVLYATGPVELRAGLNIVYGRNGAGKTRFIDGVRDALRGVRTNTRSGLIVYASRDHHEAETSSRALQTSITTVLAKAIASPDDFEYFVRGKPQSSQILAPLRASQLLDEYLADRLPASGEAREWALSNRMFILIPVGTESVPGWEAFPVTDPRLDWVREEEQALDLAHQEYDSGFKFDDEDDYDETKQETLVAAYRQKVSESTVFPTQDRELWPSVESEIWRLNPYSPLGYGFDDSYHLESIAITGEVDFGVRVVDYTQSIETATSTYLSSAVGLLADGLVTLEDHDTDATESAATAAADLLSEQVTQFLQATLLDGPYARLHLSHPSRRLYSAPFEWRFSRDSNRTLEVPIERLSRAERLWADRAIVEAVHAKAIKDDESLTPTLFIYDEPESALHRSAEAYMARSLVSRAQDPRTMIVAATHSPELLDSSAASVIEIQRLHRQSLVHELDVGSREALGRLGLNPSDLLRLTRIFLLVEGMHDQVLLEYFLGERLRRARVVVIPIRGGKHLAGTTDSRVLFEYTNAHVVALLDNTDAARIDEVWRSAVEAAATGNVDEAKQHIVTNIGYGDGESQYLTSWLTRALDFGLVSRLSPEGLGAADIIEYLPVQRIVERAASWDELHLLHEQERREKSGIPRRFKDWLEQKYRVKFDESALLNYAAGLDVPQHFERLMKSLEARSGDR